MRCLFTALALGLVLGGSPARAAEPEAPSAARKRAELGAAYYRSFCASCHGLLGHGEGPVARVLAIPPPDLTRLVLRPGGFRDDEVARAIDGREDVAAHGDTDMPVWGEVLSPAVQPRPGGDPDAESIIKGRIAAIVAYLRTLQVTFTGPRE